MRQFIDVTGKTEDEAISRALEQLGLDRDDVSVEILERAKAGFLGLGSCPAKVRVSYGPEEESASQQPRADSRAWKTAMSASASALRVSSGPVRRSHEREKGFSCSVSVHAMQQRHRSPCQPFSTASATNSACAAVRTVITTSKR